MPERHDDREPNRNRVVSGAPPQHTTQSSGPARSREAGQDLVWFTARGRSMPRFLGSSLAAVAIVLTLGSSAVPAQDVSRPVQGGGISAAGWVGQIDPKEKNAGEKLDNAKLAMDGDALHVTTGPAVAYWKPDNKASGNYTVKATFKEPKYMNLNNHPHPYGIFIAGNDMGTDQQSYLYCATYGNGNFIVRGFGPTPFQMNGPRGSADPAVNKAAAVGEPVTQEIAM